MPPFVDITGKKFGRLKALHPTHKRSGSRNVVWQCRCDCGATPLVYGNHLRNGNTTSCGCMKIEMFTDMATTHGMAQTLTYRIWAGMMQRCYNPNHTAYEMYGGRGRTADKSWHKFEGFFADMGECPEGMTLDRYPKRDGNYEKNNCRWASPQQQVINTDRVDEAFGIRRKGRGFEARIKRGQQLYLGTFDTEEEAIAVRREVKEQLDAADATIVAVTLMALPTITGSPPDCTGAASIIQYVRGMGIRSIAVGPFHDSRPPGRIVLTTLLVLNGEVVALRFTSGVASSSVSSKKPSPSVAR